ncbi:cholecystokinin receptor-like [Ptychodera flava]|uniref:cholecystokinin receptor-like n=1 Tax=Ptychodera flava TaxID=63121 RepID=UPI00396A3D44
MLTALSVERYIVIVHPLMAKTVITKGRARRLLIILWVFALLYSIPQLLYKKHVKWTFGDHPPFYTCDNSDDKILGKAYSLYLLLGMYLIPLLIMTFCYVRIIYELWISTKTYRELQQRQEMPRRDCSGTPRRQNGKQTGLEVCRTNKQMLGVTRERGLKSYACQRDEKSKRFEDKQLQGRKQVIRMLMVAVCLFMICWGPLLWLKFAIEFGFMVRYSPTKTYLSISFNLLSYLNSCMNPICYAFISRTFRECFYWAITASCSGKPQEVTAGKATSTVCQPQSLQRMRKSETTATPTTSPGIQKRQILRP